MLIYPEYSKTVSDLWVALTVPSHKKASSSLSVITNAIMSPKRRQGDEESDQSASSVVVNADENEEHREGDGQEGLGVEVAELGDVSRKCNMRRH